MFLSDRELTSGEIESFEWGVRAGERIARERLKKLFERDTPKKYICSATAKTLCPACKKVWITYENRFCHYCGQRLEWSEE